MFYSNQRKDMGSYARLEGKVVVSSRVGVFIIKAVVQYIPVYSMSVFKLSMDLCKDI